MNSKPSVSVKRLNFNNYFDLIFNCVYKNIFQLLMIRKKLYVSKINILVFGPKTTMQPGTNDTN